MDMAERKYLHDTLKETGDSILKKQTEVIQQYRLFRSGELKERRRWDIRDTTLGIHFVKYLRFLDMRKLSDRKKARAYNLYNRILFGHLSGLRRKLMYGFTQEVRDKIIKHLEF